jgi:hypothetical protein
MSLHLDLDLALIIKLVYIYSNSHKFYLQNNSFSILSIKAPFEVLQTNTENSEVLSNHSLKMDKIDTIVKVDGKEIKKENSLQEVISWIK